MYNSHEFLVRNGDKTFAEVPFGGADSFCLCQSFYMPVFHKTYETIGKKEVPYPELAMKAFDLFGGKYKKVGMVLSPQISVRLVQLGRSKRYHDVVVTDSAEVFETSPAVQFAAMTLRLPDGTAVVLFRGTDDSVIGWKEDLDILVKRGMPSHQLALDYLEKTADENSGKIIICGHSKGGNLALWAALNCRDATRARIRSLYNLEGPGFHNYDLYNTKEYLDLLPAYEHLVPTASFVGMMLAHDNDFKVVKNSVPIGPIQHDLSYWLVEGSEPAYAKGLTLQGKLNNAFLKRVTTLIPEQYYDSIEKVASGLVKGLGQLYLTGFVQNVGSSVRGAVAAWKALDPDVRQDFRTAFKGTPSAVIGAVKDVARENKAPAEAPAEAPAPAPAMA